MKALILVVSLCCANYSSLIDNLLGYKVLFVALILAVFFGCLGKAISLVLNGRPEAGVICWAVGVSGVLLCFGVGFPLVLELF